MDKGAKISNDPSFLNDIISKQEATTRVKTEDDDKVLRLILSLLSSYEHIS